jgi:probable rRNA maturation factor
MSALEEHVVHVSVVTSDYAAPELPSEALIKQWVALALEDEAPCEVSVCIVDEAEGRALNHQWRGKDAATNVLSFPAQQPDGPRPKPLGDVVLCAPIIASEAIEQGKSLMDHWAHLLIHGVLHLRGFDHDQSDTAARMEQKEVVMLKTLGVEDPYQHPVTEAGA